MRFVLPRKLLLSGHCLRRSCARSMSSKARIQERLHDDLRCLFRAGIEAVKPANLLRKAIQYEARSDSLIVDGRHYVLTKNVHVVGFGKAVLGMACELEKMIGQHIKSGILSVPTGTRALSNKQAITTLEERQIRICEGATYNMPDAQAEHTANEILKLVTSTDERDLVIALVSGGGSALLPVPSDGITLSEKRKVIESMGKEGASIQEMNIVRQLVSKTKGGKLAAAAAPAKVLGLVLSDILGDPLNLIASGPTVPLSTDLITTQKVLSKYQHLFPLSVEKVIMSAVTGQSLSNERGNAHNVLIGSNIMATSAIADAARLARYDEVVVWSHAVEGEACLVGKLYAEVAHFLLKGKDEKYDWSAFVLEPFPASMVEEFAKLTRSLTDLYNKRVCILSGGETTVTVTGDGKGGRNQELALAFSEHLHVLQQRETEQSASDSQQSFVAFGSVGSDGQDGPTDAAGATVDGMTWEKAVKQKLNPKLHLGNNDSYTLFSKFQDNCAGLVQTGLTGTNVMDFHILLAWPASYMCMS